MIAGTNQQFVIIEKDGKKIMVTFDRDGVVDTIHELKTIRADQPIGKFVINEKNSKKLVSGEIPSVATGWVSDAHVLVN